MELDSEVNELQDEFPLHHSRARKWSRYIGDVETIKQEVGQNAPENYVDLILEREAAIATLRKRKNELDNELISPLRRWRQDRRESLGCGSRGLLREELFQEYNRRCEVVRSYLFSKDDELKKAQYKLSECNHQLTKIYVTYLEDQPTKLDTKKKRIIELKRSFPYLRASDNLVADVVDTTHSYAQQIKYLPDVGIRDRQVPTQLRNRTLKRDNHACVRCDSTNDLEAHHIIPRRDGGPDSLENMATLCNDCHTEIHRNTKYDTKSEFWQEYAHEENRP